MFSPLTSDLQQLHHLLDMKANAAPDAQIILVSTFSDELDMDGQRTLCMPALTVETLRKKYPKIISFLAIDSRTGRGIPELRSLLCNATSFRSNK